MQRAQGKENKEQRSLISITARDDVSDSEDDKPLSIDVLKKSAVKRLPFSNSPVKRNALVVTQVKGNIRKQRYDPVSNQKQRWSGADRRERLCLDYASHQSVVYGDMGVRWHDKTMH